LIRIETVAYGRFAHDKAVGCGARDAGNGEVGKRQPLKIVSTLAIQPVRKSAMVVPVYDSVDKRKNG
jgi:hypothetical protein